MAKEQKVSIDRMRETRDRVEKENEEKKSNLAFDQDESKTKPVVLHIEATVGAGITGRNVFLSNAALLVIKDIAQKMEDFHMFSASKNKFTNSELADLKWTYEFLKKISKDVMDLDDVAEAMVAE